MAIFLQSAINALDTAIAVEKVLENSKKYFPERLDYKIPYDSTAFVKISIKEVAKTFVEAILLVIAIIFLFLQKYRATLISILAVIVSIIEALTGMYMFGFSINLLTLFVLVLAIIY
ncbi:MAG: efflux RND transporter permease subunit [Candidatus Paceibacteria bacterium]